MGRVTSGTFAPKVERAVCLAYVDRAFAKPSTRLSIDVRGNEAVGVVVEGPFSRN